MKIFRNVVTLIYFGGLLVCLGIGNIMIKHNEKVQKQSRKILSSWIRILLQFILDRGLNLAF